MKACTFFGNHECSDKIYNTLLIIIEELITAEKVDTFYVGNQGDFDRMVCRALADIKTRVKNIKCFTVLAYIPGKKREGELPPALETILPEGIETVLPKFAISYRNRWMVKNSDFVVVYPSDFGNSERMTEYSRRKGKVIKNRVNSLA